MGEEGWLKCHRCGLEGCKGRRGDEVPEVICLSFSFFIYTFQSDVLLPVIDSLIIFLCVSSSLSI